MKKYSLFSNYMYIHRKLTKGNSEFCLITLVTVLVGVIIPLTSILFPKVMIDVVISESTISKLLNNITTDNTEQLLFVIFIFFLITTVARATQTYFTRRNNFYFTNLGYTLKEDIQQKSMTMNYSMVEDKEVLNKIQIANECIKKCKNIIETACNVLWQSIIILIYVYLLLKVNFILILLLIFNTFINSKLLAKIKTYEANLRRERAGIDRRKNYLFETMFDYNYGKEIRLFDMKNILVNKFIEQKKIKQNLNIAVEKKKFAFSLCEGILYFIREGLVYGILVSSFLHDKITIDNFVMYIGLVTSFAVIAKALTEDVGKMIELSPYITDYRMFVEKDKQEKEQNKKDLSQYELETFSIEFRNVSFKYPKSEKYVLKNISFIIENGSHVSIVGLNGAGKTSIVKLICRFYEPTKGQIYLNGINIQEYSKESYLKRISAVFQESKLFAFSVIENISLDFKEPNKESFWRIIESLDMKDQIEKLSGKENTNVLKNLYDDGVEFSGGEKQRLCIARGMYKNADLLLLDEPTAALDALAEKKIYESFSTISKGKTTIFISHRLNSNKFCDKVIFLEKGEIAAQGSHEEMIKNCETYKKLYQMQAHYYIKNENGGDSIHEAVQEYLEVY